MTIHVSMFPCCDIVERGCLEEENNILWNKILEEKEIYVSKGMCVKCSPKMYGRETRRVLDANTRRRGRSSLS